MQMERKPILSLKPKQQQITQQPKTLKEEEVKNLSMEEAEIMLSEWIAFKKALNVGGLDDAKTLIATVKSYMQQVMIGRYNVNLQGNTAAAGKKSAEIMFSFYQVPIKSADLLCRRIAFCMHEQWRDENPEKAQLEDERFAQKQQKIQKQKRAQKLLQQKEKQDLTREALLLGITIQELKTQKKENQK